MSTFLKPTLFKRPIFYGAGKHAVGLQIRWLNDQIKRLHSINSALQQPLPCTATKQQIEAERSARKQLFAERDALCKSIKTALNL